MRIPARIISLSLIVISFVACSSEEPIAPSITGPAGDETREVGDSMTIALEAKSNPSSGTVLHIATEGFTWTPQYASSSHYEGEGHAFLYVDDVKTSRIYTEWFHLGFLPPGDHEIAVELVCNDHEPYTNNGTPIRAAIPVQIQEDEGPVDVSVTHEADAMDVALMVMKDAEEGWNVYLFPEYMDWAPSRIGEEHEIGEGHAHLYIDGELVAEVLGTAHHLPQLDSGSREISVKLVANDHGVYISRRGEVVYSMTVEVP